MSWENFAHPFAFGFTFSLLSRQDSIVAGMVLKPSINTFAISAMFLDISRIFSSNPRLCCISHSGPANRYQNTERKQHLIYVFYTLIIILIHFRKKTTPARYTVLRYLRKTCVNPFIGLKGLKGLPKSPNFWKTYFGLFTLKDIIPTNVRDQPILQTQMKFQIFIFLYISLLWYFFFSLIFLLRFW